MAPKKTTVAKKATTAAAVPVEDDTTELFIEKGEVRDYIVSSPTDKLSVARSINSLSERGLIFLLAGIGLYVRFSNLSTPNSVVFDEVHFGGFARKYILGNFFMDVHPPLAKLMFAAIAYLGGFKGNFEFKDIGNVYPKDVPYLLMREMSCFLGIATVIFMYLTLRATGCKPIIAFATSLLLIVENANATLAQYILLDSPLIFFIAATTYGVMKIDLYKNFSKGWFKFLFFTGLALGCALSSKWVGLFTFAWVGAVTAVNLWFTIGDLKISSTDIVKKTTFKLVGLIGVPAVIYLASFAIHFQLLTHEGDGAAFLSSAFRSSFDDTNVPKETFASVGVSSIVTLRHLNTNGGYLHSHDHLYEGGSGQQQVTLYPHLDANNEFQIELYNFTGEPLEFIPILHGTKIRLRHLLTHRRIHAHDIRPAVSEIDWQNEASCYGFEGFEGDPNDDFIVEIDYDQSVGLGKERVRAIESVFRLRHAMTGCYLWSHETKLPKWGFEQQEVTCATQGIKPLSYWYIEQNENIYLPKTAEKVSYKKLTFLEKVVELHKRMWHVNNGLTQPHSYESKPDTWPSLTRGISYWRVERNQIYLLGNPIIWWLASFLFIPFGIYTVVQVFRWKFNYPIAKDATLFNYNLIAVEFLLGWFIHYFPSFLMGRQMFLHHYVPALYFAILALGQTLEVIYSYVLKNQRQVTHALIGVLLASSVYHYYQRAPLVYGTNWTKSQCEASKMVSGWDYDCNIYPETLAEYANPLPSNGMVQGGFQQQQVPVQQGFIQEQQPQIPVINFDQAKKIEVPEKPIELVNKAEPGVEVAQEPVVDSTVEENVSEVSNVVAETPVVEEESAAEPSIETAADTFYVPEESTIVEENDQVNNAVEETKETEEPVILKDEL